MKIQLLLVVLPILTLQWWDVGHMLTAQIALIRLKQLNPFVSIRFIELVQALNNLVDQRTRTFAEAACWPDDLKERKYNMELWNQWHFINKPYLTDGVFPQINFTGTVVNSCNVVKNAVRTLSANIDKVTVERALFARYLVHVTGDIHQPLHSVALYNQTYPTGDRGGNSIKIELQNKTEQNLHSFWDSGAFKIQNDTWFLVRPLNLANQTALNSVAYDYIKQYGDSVEEISKNLDPFEWAKESLELSQNTTYPKMAETNVIDQEYTDMTFAAAKKRVVLAGYRIANTVISIYENNTYEFPNEYSKFLKEKISGSEMKVYTNQ